MKDSRPSWVQMTLLARFDDCSDDVAIRDCTSDRHQEYRYGELSRKVFSISGQLRPFYGERALLLLPGDSQFVFGFLACVISGVTAVPVNLPGVQRLRRVRLMLEHILQDCQPRVILALSSSKAELERMGWHQNRTVIYLDQIAGNAPGIDLKAIRAASGPILLQYSSGSTGKPKAVCNHDDNIHHHHQLMTGMHPTIDRIHVASWLPFYHDLGLFYGLLYPLLSGGCSTFIRPSQFIRDPYSWLALIDRYRANVVMAPDFAYQLCVESVSPAQAGQLDLSCLEEALTAAEPIRPATLDAFSAHFASSGFRPDMWMTGYGMAEATLVVCYQAKGTALVRKRFDEKHLAAGRAVESPCGRELVSSGNCMGSWTLKIVDPDTRMVCEDRKIGEVWISGNCMPQGYWQNPGLTDETFHARLADSQDNRNYLRTGDLAFLLEGELFICGREKDVVIVAGENHMPNDIEASIETYCELVNVGGACFVQDAANGKIYGMCEVHRHTPVETLEALAREISALVLEHHQLLPEQLILVTRGGLKKTSSGKIRRSQMLADWYAKQLKPLFVSEPQTEPLAGQSNEAGLQTTDDFVSDSLKKLLGGDRVDEFQGFADMGLTSLVATRWCAQLARYYQLSLSPTVLFAYPNLKSLRAWLESKTSRLPSTPYTYSEPQLRQVAVVAISCRLPQQKYAAWSTYADWLAKGENALTRVDSSLRSFSLPVGAIDDIDKFDAAFFGITATEARLMDPQHRWLLESSWHLFEQAGWFPEKQKGQALGVFIGQDSQDYSDALAQMNDSQHAKSYLATGNSRSAGSGRIAKFFGTRGPAITIDTACSSSLVAVDMAVDYIRSGKGRTAIAGGVNCLLSSQTELALQNAGMLSPNGRCATFSHDADGYARAEGMGLLLLKDYQQARQDGDPVLAVIEASGVAQDGESSSLTAPNPLAQQALLQEVLEQSGGSIDDLDAIELHGTGTSLGDPIELSAIDGVYGCRQEPLHLTAAKSQFGHLESAAGVAGVIRAIAQMQHQCLFGHPTFDRPNPHLQPWLSRYCFSRHSQPKCLKRMAVSAMSFTGTLAHLILRHEPEREHPVKSAQHQAAAICYLPLAAADRDALRRYAHQWAEVLSEHPDERGQLLDAWLCHRSHQLPVRACIAYQGAEQLIAALLEFSADPQASAPDTLVGQTLPSPIRAWVDGASYDWSLLAGQHTFSVATRMALPLYPFAKEAYWATSEPGLSHPLSASVTLLADVDREAFLRQWLADTLMLDAEAIGEADDLIGMGIDSLQMMDLVDEAKKLGICLDLARMYESPTVQDWLKLMQGSRTEGFSKAAGGMPQANSSERWLGKPFELTGVQQAYWQGRNRDQVLGGVACQVYLELNQPELDGARLNRALEALTLRHSMLRLRMQPDGRGIITDQPAPQVTEHQWQDCDGRQALARQMALREQLQSQVLDLEQQSGLSVHVSHTAQGSRLHINIDMVIADALSIHILVQEMARFYAQPPQAGLLEATEHFPRYLHHMATRNGSKDARQYWLERIPDLPGAPALPMAKRPEAIAVPVFSHRDWRLPQAHWQALKETCRHHRVTPSMLLAACYAETLRGWSEQPDFCLNLTIFNRRFDAFDISDMVADFTTLMLLECHRTASDTLLDNALGLNQTFMRNLDHSQYDAVQVLKEMSRQHGAQVTMPVVFTSNLGHDFLEGSALGTLDYIVSQTPQVWIDCQVMEQHGELIVSWDTVDDLFPPQMLDQMFGFMGALIFSLSEDSARLHQPVEHYLNPQQQQLREQRNRQELVEFQPRTLHGRFFDRARRCPDNIAVIDENGSLTYRQLAAQSESLADQLFERGVCVGDRVAILLPKSRSQVVAVLATHLLGAAYVPLDVEQPLPRLKQIIDQASPRCIVVDEQGQELLSGLGGITPESLVSVEVLVHPGAPGKPDSSPRLWPRFLPTQHAYIIYTSGSTGIPKGVVATHQAAANTIDDINARIQMRVSDRVFALSALNFDLSVFDIFAPLSVGAALVMPNSMQLREARTWLQAMEQHQVTVWNSVPAMFDMLLIAAERTDARILPGSLRQVLLSGDWVGLDLHPRLKALSTQTRIAALGGATEAAIWSNWFDIETVHPEWKSVPYGYSLSHQYYRVMDESRRDCPDWVAGELWIGGEGVAVGYFNDPQKTADQFVIHEGKKYYRTGDMGRFWPEGIIEFIGRRDNQVKIRGYRIELGEIEHVAAQYPGVKRAVALVTEQSGQQIQLMVQTDTSVTDTSFVRARGGEAALAASRLSPMQWLTLEDAGGTEVEITAYIADRILRQLLDRSGQVTPCSLDADEWCAALSVADSYRVVIEAWLKLLVQTRRWQQQAMQFTPTETFVELADRLPVDEVAPSYQGLLTALENRVDWYAGLLQGQVGALELLDDPDLTPEVLVLNHPELPQVISYLCTSITQLSAQLGRPVNVVELNGREGRLAGAILSHCDPEHVRYRVTESAASMREKAVFRLAGFGEHVQVLPLSACEPLAADVVISNNALHRFANINHGIDSLAGLLAPGGHFMVLETQHLSPLAWLTVCLLQPELFSGQAGAFEDSREGDCTPLLNAQDWEIGLAYSSLETELCVSSHRGDLVLLSGRQSGEVLVEDTRQLESWLAQHLPAYMVPKRVTLCESIPLTANGKVDRKQLLAQVQPTIEAVAANGEACQTENESLVADIWHSVLGVNVDRHSNFFQLGGDSLHATRIVAALDEAGIRDVRLADLFNRPVLQEFARHLKRDESENRPAFELLHHQQELYQPFVLTDVQQAYITGRQEGLVMGGVGTHFYSEFEDDQLDIERFRQALMRVIERHHTLRIVFDEPGEQRFLPTAPHCPLDVITCKDEVWDETVARMRSELSHKVLDPTQWPLFHLTVIVSDQGQKRLCVGLDNAILDGLSMRIFFAELGMCYRDPEVTLPALGVTFKDYQDQVYARISAGDQEKSQDYWRARLANLPDAPRLPLAKEPNQLSRPRFVRRKSVLPREQWQKLTDKARGLGVTPSCLLLNSYASVLASWSENPALSINVTLFDRRQVHADIHHIMGDFTSLLLLETVQHESESWLAATQRLQQRLWQDLEHADVSAVWVLRQLAELRQVSDVSMPVVFTSALGADTALDESSLLSPANTVWGVSQTPQVWIDHQVYEHDGALHFNWDVVESLFPEGMIDAMFTAYCTLLTHLTDHDWHQPCVIGLPPQQHAARERVNQTHGELPGHAMHEAVYQQMLSRPDQVAVVLDAHSVSYGALHQWVSQAASVLEKEGVRAGECVGVMLPRSVEQVVAVLAIQWIGAAYVPIAADWPESRVASVLNQAGISRVIVRLSCLLPGDARAVVIPEYSSQSAHLLAPVPRHADDLAYVIFTSGSTGEPKGVAITHGAAMNTILAINHQHQVSSQDAVLALSALYFDLSVYDIFGLLSAGGKVVLIRDEESRDVAVWLRLLQQHQVSLWNTVPALMDMLLLRATQQDLESLRCVMLSGDWIPLALPDRLKACNPQVKLVSMGGATEASIWSNYWLVESVDPAWKSIPYGFPLQNQKFRVVNECGNDCPDWVSGELWIGGEGVALGYIGNEVLTGKQFCQFQGERWYRTGDSGRYWPDGRLEFLGRRDQQVKIAGLRIELDEISQALRCCPQVEDALVMVEPHASRPRIHAYLLASASLDFVEVEQTLRRYLPPYAMPDGYAVLSQWPLTANGKIDRKQLSNMKLLELQSTEFVAATTPEQCLLTEALAEILGRSEPMSIHDNFFAIGGDSFAAIQLTAWLEKQHQIKLPLQSVFNLQTIGRLAQEIAIPDQKTPRFEYEEGSI
ncbi:non-ribosomal peptide synthetase [Halomonas sp. FME65]|uniref:non-ribosomal peptide synthetase n=1 Tax=Halomonas sp. FME65 TaxID=2742614 RepID=UPI0018665BC5|nr:non-ribosomal peptide synthetase [Halomonas sp. FME65]